MACKSSLRYRGFTMIELMCVAGIVVVVVAITLPALNKARAMAERTQCVSNLRSIGVAITTYSNQNKGFLPELRTNNYEGTQGWSGYYPFFNPTGQYWFATLIDTKHLQQPALTSNADPEDDGQTVNNPISNLVPQGILACPSEKLEQIQSAAFPGFSSGWAGSHYGMNSYLGSPDGYSIAGGSPYFLRWVQVKRPESVCMVADGPREGFPGRVTGSLSQFPSYATALPAIRHGKYWQAVHVDGHVAIYDTVPADDDPLFKP